LLFKVQVQFNSDILTIVGDSINIGIREKPIKGKANKAIIKKLANHFDVSTSQIKIKKGAKSDTKIIEILK